MALSPAPCGLSWSSTTYARRAGFFTTVHAGLAQRGGERNPRSGSVDCSLDLLQRCRPGLLAPEHLFLLRGRRHADRRPGAVAQLRVLVALLEREEASRHDETGEGPGVGLAHPACRGLVRAALARVAGLDEARAAVGAQQEDRGGRASTPLRSSVIASIDAAVIGGVACAPAMDVASAHDIHNGTARTPTRCFATTSTGCVMTCIWRRRGSVPRDSADGHG